MVTPIHRNHAANIVAKAARWVDALETMDALRVPRALVTLEAAGPAGKVLAGDGWARLAEAVTMLSGRTESVPESTRDAIAALAMDRQSTVDRRLNTAG